MGSSLRKHIITLSGTPCSGKSTSNTILAQRLDYQTYSLGSEVKRRASELGIEPEQFYKQNEIEIDGKIQSLDDYLDGYQQELGEEKEKFILDSRLGFYFVPQSFKIFLSCDTEEAAKRSHQTRGHERLYQSVEKAKQTIAERAEFEKINYQQKYGIPNFHLPFHYDLVIDTTAKKPEEIVEQIIQEYQRYGQRTEDIKLLCRGHKMFVAKSFAYFSGPITGGKSLYDAMKKHNVKRKDDLPPEAYGRIVDENLKRSMHLKNQLEQKAGKTFILPGEFGSDKSGKVWSQRDYVDLSKEMIRIKATELVFENGWEYSNGSVEEFLLALRLKKQTFDQQDNPLKKEKAISLLEVAVGEIHQAEIECPKLDYLLEQLRRMH